MSQIVHKHLDALAASMNLALAQIEALRHALAPVPSAAIDLPARCAGIAGDECALRDGEWNTSRRTLGNPSQVQCDGCGADRSGATGD